MAAESQKEQTTEEQRLKEQPIVTDVGSKILGVRSTKSHEPHAAAVPSPASGVPAVATILMDGHSELVDGGNPWHSHNNLSRGDDGGHERPHASFQGVVSGSADEDLETRETTDLPSHMIMTRWDGGLASGDRRQVSVDGKLASSADGPSSSASSRLALHSPLSDPDLDVISEAAACVRAMPSAGEVAHDSTRANTDVERSVHSGKDSDEILSGKEAARSWMTGYDGKVYPEAGVWL